MGSGPANLDDPVRGSFDGSGKLARCVGGGEPDAADMVEEGPRGTDEGAGDEARDPPMLGASLPSEARDENRSLCLAGVVGREGFGDVWNGFGESAMVSIWQDGMDASTKA